MDIIIDNGIKQIPLEIKSGRTIKKDFFKGLGFWEKLTQDSNGIVLYGGDEAQIRSGGIQVKSWRDIGEL